MRARITLVLTVLAIAPVSTLSAQRWGSPDGAETCREIWREYGRTMHGHPDAVYCEIRDAGVRPTASTIEVDGGAQSGVFVRGGARKDVRVRLVIQAQGGSVDEAKQLAQRVRLDGDWPLRVSGVTPRDRWQERNSDRFVSATFVLDVPQESNLSLDVGYAPLEVENVRGKLDLRADHGPLTARDVGGEVRARVTYGPLLVDVGTQKWVGAGLDAEADYGPVTLRVPRNFNADLEIGALHGPFDIDFPLTLTRFDRSLISTKLGTGGPRVHAVARYGPFSLKESR